MSAEIIRPRLGKAGPTDWTARHAAAFRELEPLINDIGCMAKLAMRAAIDADGPDNTYDERVMAVFTACHLHDMANDLRSEYQRLHGDES
jgi:hypothetical protein